MDCPFGIHVGRESGDDCGSRGAGADAGAAGDGEFVGKLVSTVERRVAQAPTTETMTAIVEAIADPVRGLR
jgi:hypothetical protein